MEIFNEKEQYKMFKFIKKCFLTAIAYVLET